MEDVGVGFRLTAPFPPGELDGHLEYVAFDELLTMPATRVIVRSPEHTPEEFLRIIERVGLHGVSYAVGWTAWLDLAPDGISKASALETGPGGPGRAAGAHPGRSATAATTSRCSYGPRGPSRWVRRSPS